MKYDKWKSQVDITASLIEVLYGLAPEGRDQAGEADQRTREVLKATMPEAVSPQPSTHSRGERGIYVLRMKFLEVHTFVLMTC